MARQARNYLTGAVSGTALIGIAVVAFVMLVSLQTLREWPLAGLGFGGGDSAGAAAVAPGRPAATPVGGAGAAIRAAAQNVPSARGRDGSRAADSLGGNGGSPAVPDSGSPVANVPNATAPGSAPGPTDGGGGSSPSSPAGSTASSDSGSGPVNRPGGGLPNPPGIGGAGGGAAGSGSSLTGAVTNTVNETVSGVDTATGGALGNTGVTKVTEEVVNGAAGPESPVGETVDKTVEKVQETVGGLLGGHH